jgi:hypothetical protein
MASSGGSAAAVTMRQYCRAGGRSFRVGARHVCLHGHHEGRYAYAQHLEGMHSSMFA